MSKKPTIVIPIETKNFSFEVKSIDEEQGIIKGYLAVFNNIDSQKDRIKPQSFKKTLADAYSRKDNRDKKFLFPLLWFHIPEQPIGGFTDAQEDAKGLFVTAQLDISTNDHGIPNNPIATSVFSGFKLGFIDCMSIGYKAIQKSYDSEGIRDITEIQLYEGSALTSGFSSNSDALVTDVKSLDVKVASGGTFPLADRATPWSKSKAIQDIEKATNGDWSKATPYFFWHDANPSKEADFKLPFVAMSGGEMKAIPQGIISVAGVLQGAMGGAKGLDDVEGIKAKVAHYYSLMKMTPPWTTTDKGTSMDTTAKQQMPSLETKDFQDYYRMRQIADWADRWSSLTQALRSAVLDAFNVGDSPDSDVSDALNGSDDSPGFVHALMDWVNEGIALNVSNYMKQPDVDSLSNPSGVGYTALGYMSRNDKLDLKAGAVVSKDNADRLKGHIDTMMQVKDMVGTVADDMQRYITGQPPFADASGDANQTTPNAGSELDTNNKATSVRPQTKEAPNTSTQPHASTDEDDTMKQFLALVSEAFKTTPNNNQ